MKQVHKFTMNFVCFECQASYFRSFLIAADNIPKACPKCQTPMTYVTTKYKPPRKADSKSWAIDRLLAGAKMLTYSPRFADGAPPEMKVTNLREAEDAIQKRLPSYQQTLKTRKALHKRWRKQREVQT